MFYNPKPSIRTQASNLVVMCFFLLIASGLFQCAIQGGSGRISGGTLTVPDCDDKQDHTFKPLNFKATFLSLEKFEDTIEIRIQKGGKQLINTDSFLIQLLDYNLVLPDVGNSLTVGPEENIRISAVFYETCPGSNTVLQGTGTIVFDKLGLKDNEKVAGGFDIKLSSSAEEEVSTTLTGIFDFPVRLGQPFQHFPSQQ
jgi:hypothetical protein